MLTIAKALVRRVVPYAACRAARDFWEDVRDWIGAFVFGFGFLATCSLRPKFLLYFGFAPGDDLLCTTVLRELRQHGRTGLLMVSAHRELFIGDDDPVDAHPLWRRYYTDRSTAAICELYPRIWGGDFQRPHYAPLEGNDRSRP